MQARKTSFSDSVATRVFYHLPLPVAVKKTIRKLYNSLQSFDSSAFAEPGTLNNQQEREKAVKFLLAAFQPSAIIETGTYLGAGVKFFLQNSTDCPIYSCEIAPEYFDFCTRRFAGESRIHLFCGNSIDFLQQINMPAENNRHPLFYLDAHWDKDLPLKAEIDSIFTRWPGALVMIDDFAVPHDTGYRYDDYGNHNILNTAYLRRITSEVAIFYPKAPSAMETGAKRGCCFICKPSTRAYEVLSGGTDFFVV